MTIADLPIPNRPLFVIEERLMAAGAALNGAESTDPTGLLNGLLYDKEGIIQTMGADLLPAFQLAGYTAEESTAPGAASGTYTLCDITLQFIVMVQREAGFIRRVITDPIGALEYVSRIADAIEHNAAGVVDTRLENTLGKPLKVVVRENLYSDLMAVSIVELQMQTVRYCRGERVPVVDP